jgi:hypothetical protein
MLLDGTKTPLNKDTETEGSESRSIGPTAQKQERKHACLIKLNASMVT